MRKEDILEALRKEEERRRREAKRHEKEILNLMEEQSLDFQGKLWGENSFSALAEAEEARWDGDVIARLCPDYRDPERIAIVNETLQIVSKVIQSTWGENAYKLFLDWIFRATIAELAEERDIPFTQLLNQIKMMVAKCRQEVGADPSVFPFKETAGKLANRVNRRRSISRMMVGKSAPADEAGRIYLTEAEKVSSTDDIFRLLKFKGYQVSRASAYRAKARGWFMKSGWKESGDRTSGEKIYLTSEEKLLPNALLARRFGINYKTSSIAKKRGFFEVNTSNRHLVKIPEDRSLVPEEKLMAGIDSLPSRLSVLPDGRQISEMTVKEISEIFCLEIKAVRRTRKRGFLNLSTWPLKKRTELAERLKTLKAPKNNNPEGREV